MMQDADEFLDAARPLVLPLLVWAAHFAMCYVLVAIACIAGADAQRWAGLPIVTWILLLVSAAALVGLGWRAAISAREALGAISGHESLVGAHAGAALLAWVGVLWTTLPVVVLPVCSTTG